MKHSFRELQKRTFSAVENQRQMVGRLDGRLSLIDWIGHQCEAGLPPKAEYSWEEREAEIKYLQQRSSLGFSNAVVRSKSVDAAYEMSESLRQQAGRAPEGQIFWSLVDLAREEKRSFSSIDPGLSSVSGGRIWPDTKIIPELAIGSAILGGADVITGLWPGDGDLVNITTPMDNSGMFVPEGTVGTTTQPVFSALNLKPKSMVSTITISRQLAMSKRADVGAAVGGHILRQIRYKIDQSAIVGAGGNDLDGLLANGSLSVLSAGTNGLAPSWANLAALESDVTTRAGEMVSPAFIGSPKLRQKLRTTQRGTNLDFIMPRESDQLMGYPFKVSKNMPDNLTKGTSTGVCSALIFGDLNQFVVAFYGPLAIELTVDHITQAAAGMVKITAFASVAVMPKQIGAFSVYKDLLSA